MNKKIDILPLTERINKDEFEKYFRCHTESQVREHFNITSQTALKRLMSYWNIKKTKEDILFVRRNTIISEYGSIEEYENKRITSIKNTKKNLSKEEVSQSHEKRKQTLAEKYGSLEDYYSYHNKKASEAYARKSKEELDLSEKKKRQTLMQKYGVYAPSQLEWADEKRKQTIVEKYGSLENFYTLCDKHSKETLYERYGNSNYNNSEKYRKTCLEKYGVPYFCMMPQARLTRNSKTNDKFADILTSHHIEFSREFNIHTFSYDFKVDNILIEINPFVTHNSTWGPYDNPKDKYYHFNKTKLAIENGYRCICIWDWDDIDKIVNLLKSRETIYGRKCIVKEIDHKESNDFLNLYHLQNSVKSSINLGLFYEDNLVSVMTFGNPRYNKKYEYELLRYCSTYNVIGGANKLFSYFLRIYNPESIVSYCDMSKFSGQVYSDLGFALISCEVSKHWYNPKSNKHITDNLLRQRGFDQLFGKEYGIFGKGSSNEELMLSHDFVEIYDCGQSTYVYKK